MSVAACAGLVRQGDSDRFLATMAAPPAARSLLFPLYAYNLEVARAPWVTDEPLIAEMRLQWWRDALAEIGAGDQPRGHEVVVPLAELVRASGLDPALLDEIALARRWDIAREPFADKAALLAHLDSTGGNLMWAAARVLGAPDKAEPAVRGMGRAGALAAWLSAVPELAARGRHPLPDSDPQAVAGLARDGLGWIARARRARGTVPKAAVPALYPAWQAETLLTRAGRSPDLVLRGDLALSEFSRRGRLLWLGLAGRW